MFVSIDVVVVNRRRAGLRCRLKRISFSPSRFGRVFATVATAMAAIFVARPCYRLCDPLEKDHSDHILSIPLALEVMPNEADREYIRAYFAL